MTDNITPFGGSFQQQAAHAKRFHLEWAGDIEPNRVQWLVKGVLPQQGLACIYGPSNSGKSFLALEWALSLAVGLEVLGRRTKRCGVAYVAAEGAAGVRTRIAAWRREYAGAERIPLALIADTPDLRSIDSNDLSELIVELREASIEFETEGAPLGAVVLDTFASITSGMDERSGEEMGAAMNALQEIARELNCLVLIVHHSGKNEALKERGHSSLRAKMDVALEVSLEKDEAGQIINARTLLLDKCRDGERGASWGFNLRQIELDDRDEDGDPLTTCVIDMVNAPKREQVKKQRLSNQAVIVHRALQQLVSEGRGQKNVPGIQCPAEVFAVRISDALDRARSLGLLDETTSDPLRVSHKAFTRAKQQLIALSRVFEREGWLWLA